MKAFSVRRAIAVAKKEVFHILRDPFTLGAALGLPVFMVLVFGVAIEFNVKNIALSVSDSDQSQSSRRLLDTFASSQYFRVTQTDSPSEAIEHLTSEEARASLIIPLGFQSDLFAGRTSHVQILLDGSDSSTVQPVLGYVGSIQRIAAQRIASFSPAPPYEMRTRYLFNPELNSRWFVIPGLNVMVMGILSVLLTALTIAREYENGSMELLLSTPIKPLEIIIGKLAPYGVLGIMSIAFIYLVARFVFSVPFVGSHWIFGLGTLLFLVAYLCQGLLISVTTRNQQVAMQMAMITGMLPTQLLSGFVFPVESMPVAFQYITMIFPARWYMEISRDTFLKGTSFMALGASFLGLTLFALFVITLGTRRFKRDLEP
jgi:ABC-2 type transport system permease protein